MSSASEVETKRVDDRTDSHHDRLDDHPVRFDVKPALAAPERDAIAAGPADLPHAICQTFDHQRP